jgi:hypothetical protein
VLRILTFLTTMRVSSNSQAQDAMMTLGAAVAAIALLPTGSAHGYVQNIISGGKVRRRIPLPVEKCSDFVEIRHILAATRIGRNYQ